MSSCHKGSVGKSISGLTPGSVAVAPNQAPGSVLAFMVAPNSGGRATSIHMTGVRWGKLADIRDQNGVLRHKDFLVEEDVVSNSSYFVENNPVTEKTTVTILAPFSELNDSLYVTRLALLEADLTVLEDKSLDPGELPPFPLVPRNAALVLEFDDLLDPTAISAQTIKILGGYPPTTPFDARILADPNHGDLANFDGVPGLEYYTTRILIDTTVSSIEAASTNPPLPVNTLGLPASITVGQPNIVLRIPTQVDPDSAQFSLLKNPTNHFLSMSANGSIDFESGSRDLVRALRSGGGSLGDINNGFLLDTTAPSVLGTQGAFVQNLAAGPTPQTFVCDLNFALATCANRLAAGDVIQQGSVFAEVICPPFQNCAVDAEVTGPQVGSLVSTVYFRIIATDTNDVQVIEVGPALIAMRYTANVFAGKAPCFVRFPTLITPPAAGVSPSSPVIVRFTEPMDPTSIKPFDSLMVLRRDPALPTTILNAYDYVVGSIGNSADSREFTFTPALPMTHVPPATESYWVRIIAGATGAKDLAGNALAAQVPAVQFSLDSAASLQNTGGFALRFPSGDELSGVGGDATTTGVGKREFRGQFLINTEAQTMRPRPVTHFPATIDRTQASPGAMGALATGTQTPLSKLGSKMQTLWRYFDAGFTLEDESNYNVDVEGVSWAPIGSAVVADNFSRFEMSLSHCLRLPDETFNAMTQMAVFPNSGLVTQYSLNFLNASTDPQRTLYPVLGGPSGYAVIPTDIFQGSTGSKFMPWPMNRGVPTRNFVFYTWRDTAVASLGGPQTSGANPLIWYTVNGIPPPVDAMGNFLPIHAPGAIPSHALPLLLEFRCYPDDAALGLNVFDVAMATPVVFVPNFRAFSTGGVNTQNQIIRKDPDVQTVANGGFNPGSAPLPGATTLPVDNTFYMGQLNLVTRVSRVHSIWFDSTSATVQYGPPVLEPRASEQPAGTSVSIDYRGATVLTNNILLTDSVGINPYGNRNLTIVPPATVPLGGTSDPTFPNNDATWKSSLTLLNGSRFFQVRLSFVSNAETNLSPEVTSLAFSYRR